MIEKLDEYSTSSDYAIIDKINEIIDFLNNTYLMKVKDGQHISLTDNSDYIDVPGLCTDALPFITGLSMADDVIDSASESITTVTSNIKCPYCGESCYMVGESISTCVYYPSIMKNGVNINPDRNISTTHYTCLNCNKDFTI